MCNASHDYSSCSVWPVDMGIRGENDMSYTKGPWTIEETYDGIYINPDICTVQPPYLDTDAKDNASLIAAAPELLEALELMYNHARLYMSVSDNVVNAVESAIAKAKGENDE